MFYKIQKNPQGKYYPQSVTRGKVLDTKKISEKLAQISTVSEADCRAVLSMLGEVMADALAAGRSVKLDGLGTFRLVGYTGENKAVDSAKEVSSKMFEGVRVRFNPESTREGSSGPMTRAMTSGEVSWVRVMDDDSDDFAEDETPDIEGGSGSDSGSGDTGGSGSTGSGSDDDSDSPFKP